MYRSTAFGAGVDFGGGIVQGIAGRGCDGVGTTQRDTTAMDGGSANNVGNNYLPTARDGGSADFAGSDYLPTATDGGSADFAGSDYLPTARDGGSADFAGSKNLPKPHNVSGRRHLGESRDRSRPVPTE
ncbi:hypothetical protein [Candidatus Spongiihabitans sp.]|uniref:hypothetical protein n=1 Tax=Candidatus Spongiihabitans sp. TaxID=3101308 RepID=UPI003C7DF346